MPAEEKKSVKKEEPVEAKEKKKVPANGSGGKTRVKEAKVKKEEPKDESSDDEPSSTRKTSTKKTQTVKKEIKVEVKKTVAVNENGKKREKKVFDLPGQKRDPPEERDPLRIFYESLYEQVPSSEMAAFWMMECGLLSLDVAKKVFAKKQKKPQQQKLSSPVKTVASVTKSATVKKNISSPAITLQKVIIEPKTVSKTSKKRKVEDGSSSEGDDDDDFVPLANRKTATKKLKKA